MGRSGTYTGETMTQNAKQTTVESQILKLYEGIRSVTQDSFLLLFHLDTGFYLAVSDDAVRLSGMIDTPLTESKAGYPITGFPEHMLERYIPDFKEKVVIVKL